MVAYGVVQVFLLSSSYNSGTNRTIDYAPLFAVAAVVTLGLELNVVAAEN